MMYLDYAAATPVDKSVLAAMQPYFTDQFYNPSATYLAAKHVRDELNKARATVAHWIGSKPTEIIFTAGGTEANNLAIAGVMQQYPNANVVIGAIEHDAVLLPAALFKCFVTLPTEQGIVTPEAVAASVNDETVLVSIMYANNEVGTIQPIRLIAAELMKIRARRQEAGNSLPLYFHTDACQAGNYLDLHAARLGVDMMTLNGGKIYGPKQSGILYVAGHVQLQPIIRGGGQERNLRSGTENVAAAIGFAKALELVQQTRYEESNRLVKLQSLAFRCLRESLPEVLINGSTKSRLPNNVHITLPGRDNERLLVELEERGIIAAAGSACSASSDEPSHVLKAMGISEVDAQSSLRITMGHDTTEDTITALITTLSELV